VQLSYLDRACRENVAWLVHNYGDRPAHELYGYQAVARSLARDCDGFAVEDRRKASREAFELAKDLQGSGTNETVNARLKTIKKATTSERSWKAMARCYRRYVVDIVTTKEVSA
jgi:hypothetical protein